jgi:hypothetical protein
MKPHARPRWLPHLVAACAALVVQALLWASYYGFAPKQLVGDELYYRNAALAIWQGHAPPPDFIWPPLQGWLLAPLIGPLHGALWLAQVVQMAMLALSAWLLRLIWLRLDPRPWAADLAAWLLATSPAIMAFGLYLWPEPVHMLLLLGALWLLVEHAHSRVASAVSGAAVGLALLAKSLLSGFWPLFLLLFVRRPWRHSLGASALAFVVALLAVTGPATLAGWRATGKPLIADSSLFNLDVGLRDRYRSDYIDDRTGAALRDYLDAGTTPVERNEVAESRIGNYVHEHGIVPLLADRLGVQYFRLFSAKRTLVSQLPGPACAGYIGAYTVPAHWTLALRWLTEAHYALLLVAAAVGLALWRRGGMLAWLLALFFAYQLALYLGLHVKARFLLPMLPFLCGLAGSGWVDLRDGTIAATPVHRRVGALLVAVLLLALAFAGPWLDRSCA